MCVLQLFYEIKLNFMLDNEQDLTTPPPSLMAFLQGDVLVTNE